VREERYNPELMVRYYKRYHEVLERNPDIKIRQDTARNLPSSLAVSDEYRRRTDAEKEYKAAPN
jgi:hypothetical protein